MKRERGGRCFLLRQSRWGRCGHFCKYVQVSSLRFSVDNQSSDFLQISNSTTMSAPDTARKSELQYSDLSDLIEIGRGSFGRVFRADYLGTDVAVKEFLQQLPDAVNWDFDKYYGREVDMLREARHPNIVQFMGTCIQQGKVFIITEFVPGGNLKDVVILESNSFLIFSGSQRKWKR